MSNKKLNPFKKGASVKMRAKLTIDEGFAENPLYKIKAFTTEKTKGIGMMSLVQKMFGIRDSEWRDRFRMELEELNKDAMTPTEVPKELKKKQIKFLRDEKGQIVSPFSDKGKKLKR